MRNISLLSIDVGGLSSLWVTLFPRQGVLGSMRGEGQLRASEDQCLPCLCWTTDVLHCSKFLPGFLQEDTAAWDCEPNNPFLPYVAFCQGICHTHRNEANTDAQGHTYSGSRTLLTPPRPRMSSPVLTLCPKQREAQQAVKPLSQRGRADSFHSVT